MEKEFIFEDMLQSTTSNTGDDTNLKFDELMKQNFKSEILQATQDIFVESELDFFFRQKYDSLIRNSYEIARLLRELNAKAFVCARPIIFKKGLRVLEGQGYYTKLSDQNSAKIESILENIITPDQYKKLKNEYFIPEEIFVDSHDLHTELPEIIHGGLRHEIGEVLFNDFSKFIIRQDIMEKKCKKADMGIGWGKDYGIFINAIGDPRINFFSCKFGKEAEKDIKFIEMVGIMGLIDKIGELPVNHQFLMLANCREAESYVPSLVELIKKKVDPQALSFYEKHKSDLAKLSKIFNLDKFYEEADKIWGEYMHLVTKEGREINNIKKCLVLLPMPCGHGFVLDKRTGLLLPIPMEAMANVEHIKGIEKLSAVDTKENKPCTKYLDEERLDKIKNDLNQLQKEKEENQGNYNIPGLNIPSKQSVPKIFKKHTGGGNYGDQEIVPKDGNTTTRINTTFEYQKVFGETTMKLADNFRRALVEFMPREKPKILQRQLIGMLGIGQFIDTLGTSEEINYGIKENRQYFGVFSIIIDSSGSTAERVKGIRKLDYFKEVGFALSEALYKDMIPFELMDYSGIKTKDGLCIIKPLRTLHEFTIPEKNILASVDYGGQLDTECLRDSASRLLPFAQDYKCTPFFILICDGCTSLSLREAIKKIRKSGAVVIGIGVLLPENDKSSFKENFDTNGVLVDDIEQLVPATTNKLKIEVRRVLAFKS